MAELLPWPRSQFFNDDGHPLSGGRLYSYKAGSSIPLATYADKSANVPNANPVVLNARGEALVFLSAQAYKLILTDENDVQIWTIDNFVAAPTDAESLAEAIAEAQAAQAAAESARDNAEAAQVAAESARDDAEQAKDDAEDAASTATTQAGIATTKAGEASVSAGSASTSASTATTQAGIATTKAGEASDSADAAESARDDAEAARDIAQDIADDLSSIEPRLDALESPDQIVFNDQLVAPSTPGSGKLSLYSKNDKLFTKNDAGTEKVVGSDSGSSGINYLEGDDSNFEDGIGNWFTDDGTGLPSSTFNLYREGTSPLVGLGSLRIAKAAASANGHRVANDHVRTIDKAFRGMILWGELEGDFSHSNYASNDLTIQAYDVTNGVLIPAWVEGGTGGGFNSGKGRYIFRVATSTTTAQIQLRIRGNSTNATAYDVYVDEIRLGPQEYVIGASIGDWKTYPVSLTSSGGGAVTLNATGVQSPWGAYREDGDSLEVVISFRNGTGGAASGNAGNVEFSLPPGYTPNTSFIPANTNLGNVVGSGTTHTGNSSYQDQTLVALSGLGTGVRIFKSGSTSFINVADVAASFGAAMKISFPVIGRSSNTVLSNSRVEYVSNSSTSTTNDTTSFANGPDGALIQSFAPAANATIQKRCRFQSTIQPTDKITLQFCPAGTVWFDHSDTLFSAYFNDAGSTGYGVYLTRVNDNTIDVRFAYEAAPGLAWSNYTSWKWRVVKSANPLAVETATREFRSAVSSTKTPGANGNYLAMTGNSAALTPGTWMLSGYIDFVNGGSAPNYQYGIGYWGASNGTDSGTPMTSLALDAGSNTQSVFQHNSGLVANSIHIPMAAVRVTVTAPTTVYLVPRCAATTIANARVMTTIYAEKIV